MRNLTIAAAAVTAAGIAGPAHASLLWDFTFSAGGDSASGTLTTDNGNGSSYNITGITGIFDGAAITGLLPANALSFYDNVLFPAPEFLDNGGVGFSVLGGGDEIISGAEGGSGPFYDYNIGTNTVAGPGSFSATLAPEPASVTLFGAALAGLLLIRRRLLG